jgi:Domain of unknown function (DUF4129)
MTFAALGRSGIPFWMEALLASSLLMFFGYLTTGVAHMFVFVLTAFLFFLIGSWLHRSGGRFLALHLLLYPLFAGVAILSYMLFNSWLIAVILTGLLSWRIYSLSHSSLHFDLLQNRFYLAISICLMHLTLAVLFLPTKDNGVFDPAPYYGMLVLISVSYLVLNYLLYLTKEQLVHARPAARITALLGTQALATRSLIISVFLLVAAFLLWLLNTLWTWLREPLGELLSLLAKPFVETLAEWTEKLAAIIAKLSALFGGGGQGTPRPPEPIPLNEQANEVSLITAWESSIIAGIILIVVVTLTLYIWRQRKLSNTTIELHPLADARLTDLKPVSDEEAPPLLDLDRFFHKRLGPSDDPVRYAYFEFIQIMSGKGIRIYRYETSQEFLRRLREHLKNPEQLVLAERITRYYEQYRYQEHSLSNEDLAAMQQAVRQLADFAS